MGAVSVSTKRGFKHIHGTERNNNNPYAHLAAAIIIQAWLDLKRLENSECTTMDSSMVNKWEIINFFRSKWCETLLSFQETITLSKLNSAVEERLKA